MHKAKVKNGMTIEVRLTKYALPDYMKTKNFGVIEPANCLSDLGYLYIHSSEISHPKEAARVMTKNDYSFVLTPKIMSSDESLSNLPPKE